MITLGLRVKKLYTDFIGKNYILPKIFLKRIPPKKSIIYMDPPPRQISRPRGYIYMNMFFLIRASVMSFTWLAI